MELTPHTKLSVATPVALKERKKKKELSLVRVQHLYFQPSYNVTSRHI